MNKGQLIDKIAGDAEITKSQANAALASFMDAVQTSLVNGNKLTLVGFGTFSSKVKPAHPGRNPQTGETIQIAAKRVAKFKAGKGLETFINVNL
ncbi:MAG: HU family DNA-binding protein [Chitinophagales bacterium]